MLDTLAMRPTRNHVNITRRVDAEVTNGNFDGTRVRKFNQTAPAASVEGEVEDNAALPVPKWRDITKERFFGKLRGYFLKQQDSGAAAFPWAALVVPVDGNRSRTLIAGFARAFEVNKKIFLLSCIYCDSKMNDIFDNKRIGWYMCK